MVTFGSSENNNQLPKFEGLNKLHFGSTGVNALQISAENV